MSPAAPAPIPDAAVHAAVEAMSLLSRDPRINSDESIARTPLPADAALFAAVVVALCGVVEQRTGRALTTAHMAQVEDSPWGRAVVIHLPAGDDVNTSAPP
ncbi:hypothetical protein [Spongiactinospora sp. TRM90649]|uniref:hypothetical protein n=1 Tax=Spongiactinospora sp. TRM90649 TaxID=3031114 RepID=UPI0023F7B048|nr:hypothetical protein [Spongiactinospora sp. TRM90649]MDF5758590.1 hypothetical protein [Spongiactinospora sp. TRM90649]